MLKYSYSVPRMNLSRLPWVNKSVIVMPDFFGTNDVINVYEKSFATKFGIFIHFQVSLRDAMKYTFKNSVFQ